MNSPTQVIGEKIEFKFGDASIPAIVQEWNRDSGFYVICAVDGSRQKIARREEVVAAVKRKLQMESLSDSKIDLGITAKEMLDLENVARSDAAWMDSYKPRHSHDEFQKTLDRAKQIASVRAQASSYQQPAGEFVPIELALRATGCVVGNSLMQGIGSPGPQKGSVSVRLQAQDTTSGSRLLSATRSRRSGAPGSMVWSTDKPDETAAESASDGSTLHDAVILPAVLLWQYPVVAGDALKSAIDQSEQEHLLRVRASEVERQGWREISADVNFESESKPAGLRGPQGQDPCIDGRRQLSHRGSGSLGPSSMHSRTTVARRRLALGSVQIGKLFHAVHRPTKEESSKSHATSHETKIHGSDPDGGTGTRTTTASVVLTLPGTGAGRLAGSGVRRSGAAELNVLSSGEIDVRNHSAGRQSSLEADRLAAFDDGGSRSGCVGLLLEVRVQWQWMDESERAASHGSQRMTAGIAGGVDGEASSEGMSVARALEEASLPSRDSDLPWAQDEAEEAGKPDENAPSGVAWGVTVSHDSIRDAEDGLQMQKESQIDGTETAPNRSHEEGSRSAHAGKQRQYDTQNDGARTMAASSTSHMARLAARRDEAVAGGIGLVERGGQARSDRAHVSAARSMIRPGGQHTATRPALSKKAPRYAGASPDAGGLPSDPDPFAFDAVDAKIHILRQKQKKAGPTLAEQRKLRLAEAAYSEGTAPKPTHPQSRSGSRPRQHGQRRSMSPRVSKQRGAHTGNPLAQDPRTRARGVSDDRRPVKHEILGADVDPEEALEHKEPDEIQQTQEPSWSAVYPRLYAVDCRLKQRETAASIDTRDLLAAAADVQKFVRDRARAPASSRRARSTAIGADGPSKRTLRRVADALAHARRAELTRCEHAEMLAKREETTLAKEKSAILACERRGDVHAAAVEQAAASGRRSAKRAASVTSEQMVWEGIVSDDVLAIMASAAGTRTADGSSSSEPRSRHSPSPALVRDAMRCEQAHEQLLARMRIAVELLLRAHADEQAACALHDASARMEERASGAVEVHRALGVLQGGSQGSGVEAVRGDGLFSAHIDAAKAIARARARLVGAAASGRALEGHRATVLASRARLQQQRSKWAQEQRELVDELERQTRALSQEGDELRRESDDLVAGHEQLVARSSTALPAAGEASGQPEASNSHIRTNELLARGIFG